MPENKPNKHPRLDIIDEMNREYGTEAKRIFDGMTISIEDRIQSDRECNIMDLELLFSDSIRQMLELALQIKKKASLLKKS